MIVIKVNLLFYEEIDVYDHLANFCHSQVQNYGLV